MALAPGSSRGLAIYIQPNWHDNCAPEKTALLTNGASCSAVICHATTLMKNKKNKKNNKIGN